MTKKRIYDYPLYYEIAFSFVNLDKQLQFFANLIQNFGRKKLKNILDICCGPSYQLTKYAEMGFFVAGLDNNKKMLSYLDDKLLCQKAKYHLYLSDMREFVLHEKYDLAFCLMGSIHYLTSHDDYRQHLDSMAKALKKDALYIIENLPMGGTDGCPKWQSYRDNIFIENTYNKTTLNEITQMAEYDWLMKINDDGHKLEIRSTGITRDVYPQEFNLLVEQNSKFELIGFFQRNNPLLIPLTHRSPENMVVLRRK